MTLAVTPWADPSGLGAPPGGAALWWLGQAGFLIEMAGRRIVIDPYLSDSLAAKYAGTRFPHRRMMPPPAAPGDLRGIDLLLCTHGHTDHMDGGTIPALVAANPGMAVVVPRAERARAAERGVPPARMVALDAGEAAAFGPLQVTATPAAHETVERDADGCCRFLGYLIRGGGVSVWHSGDTVPHDGLPAALGGAPVDVALLPVNGRDALRAAHGVAGNLTLDEALELAQAAGARAMIGHHLEMFDFNTLDRAEGEARLARYPGPVQALLARTGLRYVLPPA
jgi:L-ascorbate metabolism protein UlaG (beta-lactamase superfamily)